MKHPQRPRAASQDDTIFGRHDIFGQKFKSRPSAPRSPRMSLRQPQTNTSSNS